MGAERMKDQEVVYPVIIAQEKSDYLVHIPDLDRYTEWKSFADAIHMARDLIGLVVMTMEDDGETIPGASDYAGALSITKEKADDDDFQYSAGVQTLVDVNIAEYRRKHDHRMVKKNCTIPRYLNEEAEKRGINFSRVLQEALSARLGE